MIQNFTKHCKQGTAGGHRSNLPHHGHTGDAQCGKTHCMPHKGAAALEFCSITVSGSVMRTSTARQLDRRRGGGAAGVLPAGPGSAQGRGGWRSGRAHPWQPFLGCSFGGPRPLSSFPTRTPNTHTVWHFSLLYALALQSLSALLCRCMWLRMNVDGLCGAALPFAVPAQTSVIVVWGGLRDLSMFARSAFDPDAVAHH